MTEAFPNSLKHLKFPIDGLNCAGCVKRVENTLNQIDGVSDPKVNLAAETAEFDYNQKTDIPKIAAALDEAGYPIRPQTEEFLIEGLNCASCVRKVEKHLLNQYGILNADVNLATDTAKVSFLPSTNDAQKIADSIHKLGYKSRLKKKLVDDSSHHKEEKIKYIKQQTYFAILLSLPVFILEMGGHMIPAFHHWIMSSLGQMNSYYLQFFLTTAVIIGPGRFFYSKGYSALFKGYPDMNSLVAIGTTAAYGYSLVATFSPSLLPFGTVNVYYEAAAVIIALILIGKWMEAQAKGQTGEAIKKLIKLTPATALILREEKIIEIPQHDLKSGDIVHVKPGMRIATDGIVLSGSSHVDESMITGEPIPIDKKAGDKVIGGTINTSGTLQFKATETGDKTVLAKIIQMVENAQAAKLPIQSMLDQVTAVFVPTVLAIALITLASWLYFSHETELGYAVVATISVLIIACPCAMGLATPTSIMVGTGRAAQMGVLFRKGDALQELNDVDVIAFDKTGTLTKGKPTLTDFYLIPDIPYSKEDILSWVASLENHSEHPISHAIVETAKCQGVGLHKPQKFQSINGKGIIGQVRSHRLIIGNEDLMNDSGQDIRTGRQMVKAFATEGKTPLYVVVNQKLCAILAVSDPIKDNSLDVIKDLKKRNIKTVMITGDHPDTANAIARQLGLAQVDVTACALPEGKVTLIKELQQKYGKVAFVGDGINDAPALAHADIGIALGSGTDIAIEAADVILMSENLRGVTNAIHVSQATLRNIKQNLFWAFGYNIVLLPIAAGVLFPSFGIMLSPLFAAAAMALSSVFVVTNALRLKFLRQTSLLQPL